MAAAGLVLVLLAIAVVVVMTRGVSWRDRFPIEEAWSPEPDVVSVIVATCHGDPWVDHLEEDDGTVSVAIESLRRLGGSGMDCLDSVDIHLGAPLGDRQLIDLTTGRAVAVQAGLP